MAKKWIKIGRGGGGDKVITYQNKAFAKESLGQEGMRVSKVGKAVRTEQVLVVEAEDSSVWLVGNEPKQQTPASVGVMKIPWIVYEKVRSCRSVELTQVQVISEVKVTWLHHLVQTQWELGAQLVVFRVDERRPWLVLDWWKAWASVGRWY